MSFRFVLLFALCWLGAWVGRAHAQRFAVIVGKNAGYSDDVDLRYAESDAEKMYAVVRDLGGFEAADMLLLKGEDADTVRRSLIAMNDRIRTSVARGRDALLFVYYSGHADSGALRLGAGRVDLTELAQLVRGSSATFRLLVVDACRSGALTRVKGGKVIDPFTVPFQSLDSEGMAFLTASAASEDAQESDEIGGSFFTHALVSGLMGAADSDSDGAVALEEAYRYAYDATLRATSRTAFGMQHPTFQYEFRGQGGLVLTRPRAAAERRATLRFAQPIGFLVMRDDEHGPVVAEMSPHSDNRALSLRPGTYYLRGRGPDSLMEGKVTLSAAEDRTVDISTLNRVQYARLVRKGEGGPHWAHAIDVGIAAQSYLPAGSTPCIGASGGYRLDFSRLSLAARAGFCRSSFDNAYLSGVTDEYDLSLAGLYVWDLPALSLGLGIGLGAVLGHQSFETTGHAPSRTSIAPLAALIANLDVDLSQRFFLRLDARAVTQLVTVKERSSEPSRLDPAMAIRAALLLGVYLGQGQSPP